MSIKVLFDHQKFTTQRYGGISRYFANIIQSLKKTPGYEYDLGVLTSNCHYIQQEKQPLKFLGAKVSNPSVAYKLNKFYCEQLLKKSNFDVFHPTYYDKYFIDKVKKPVVVTVHDMTHERLPEYFWAQDPLTHEKRLNIERADKIIAISETTKDDLLRFSNVDPSKISIVYHGIETNTPLLTAPVNNLPEQYILFVGDRGGYKNFYLFIEAFKILSQKYPHLKVVLTGGGAIGIADAELLYRNNLQSKVQHVNVTDEQLNYLYKNAFVFVYPSLCEGFGLPLLEAFKAECPIIASDIDCFKEIGGDAVLLFKALETEDLVAKVEMLLHDSSLRNKLIQNGLKRLMDFPIEKSINETLEVYKALV
ncbi:glycosyltransferase family 4 protein [Desertivirga brevis]|uniref:glycosyltransferase family 4 protein n=1 Tax=Desertivirga brevis TaxID=2810310 RepID=UPI001A97C6C9|nr:glycosyltransferase family 1 protein [Pedobacter sp. SYSU D00873]